MAECIPLPTTNFCFDLCASFTKIFTLTDDDDNPFDLTGTVVELKFRPRDGQTGFILSSDVVDDGLEITDAVNGEITFSRTQSEAESIFSIGFYDSKLIITDTLDMAVAYLDIVIDVTKFTLH